MKKLFENVRKNGFDYKLIKRSEKVAIYEQFENINDILKIISYEVFNIKIKQKINFKTGLKETYEVFPNNDELCKSIWTYSTFSETKTDEAYKNAENKYNELNKSK